MSPPRAAARPPRGRLRGLVTIGILVGFAAVVAVVVHRRRDELAGLFEDPGGDLALIGLLVLVGHFLNSSEFWRLYRAQGVDIGLGETWTLFLANQFGNLAPGQFGSLYRFRYLKAVHGLDYAASTSNFAANLAISLGSSAVAGVAGLTLLAAGGGTFSPLLVVAAVALAALALALAVFPLPGMGWLPSRARTTWGRLHTSWERLRTQPRVLVFVLVVDIAKYLVVALRFQIAFGLLGLDESYAYFLVIAPAAGLAGAIAFTPGGLGIREAFITAAAVGLGSSFDDGLLAATVDRGVMLVTALVAGGAGMAVASRRLVAAEMEDPRATGDV